jgi:3-methyladenine DNA glycosylase AlkD
MPIDVAQTVATIHERFRQEGFPERAAGEKRYLKSDLQFAGMTVPDIRMAAKGFRREHPHMTRPELVALSEALWATDWHELRSMGIAILELYAELLEPADMAMLERHLAGYNTWAHVDWLAPKVVGSLVRRFPDEQATLRRWAASPAMWVRRSALLAQLEDLRAGGGDFALFSELATPMVAEREFFIAKAIGWVLREVSKKRPALTAAFLAQAPDASPTTWREAVKYLPEDLCRPLEAARAAVRKPARSREKRQHPYRGSDLAL